MISLALKNRDMLRDNYKCLIKEESIENILDKPKILKQFSIINISQVMIFMIIC